MASAPDVPPWFGASAELEFLRTAQAVAKTKASRRSNLKAALARYHVFQEHIRAMHRRPVEPPEHDHVEPMTADDIFEETGKLPLPEVLKRLNGGKLVRAARAE